MRTLGPAALGISLALCTVAGERSASAQSTAPQREPAPAANKDEGGGSAGLKAIGIGFIVIGAAGVVAGSVGLLIGASTRSQDTGSSGELSLGSVGPNGRGSTTTSTTTETGSSFNKYDLAAATMGAGALVLGLGVALVTIGASHAPDRPTRSAASTSGRRWIAPPRVEPLVGVRSAGVRLRF